MNEEGKRSLIDAGVDYDGALHRFLNNETMYEKFLVKFPDDVNYGNILRLQEEGKYEENLSNQVKNQILMDMNQIPLNACTHCHLQKFLYQHTGFLQDFPFLVCNYQKNIYTYH